MKRNFGGYQVSRYVCVYWEIYLLPLRIQDSWESPKFIQSGAPRSIWQFLPLLPWICYNEGIGIGALIVLTANEKSLLWICNTARGQSSSSGLDFDNEQSSIFEFRKKKFHHEPKLMVALIVRPCGGTVGKICLTKYTAEKDLESKKAKRNWNPEGVGNQSHYSPSSQRKIQI